MSLLSLPGRASHSFSEYWIPPIMILPVHWIMANYPSVFLSHSLSFCPPLSFPLLYFFGEGVSFSFFLRLSDYTVDRNHIYLLIRVPSNEKGFIVSERLWHLELQTRITPSNYPVYAAYTRFCSQDPITRVSADYKFIGAAFLEGFNMRGVPNRPGLKLTDLYYRFPVLDSFLLIWAGP